MRKILSAVFSIAVAVVIAALIFVAFASLPTRNDSSLSTPQQETLAQARTTTVDPAYPPPSTPTAGATLPPLPSPTPDLVAPSPTTFPTAAADLPHGSRIIFAETTRSELTIWAASAINPSQRIILARIDRDIKGFNGSISPNLDKFAVVATEALNSRINATLYVLRSSSGKITPIATGIALGRYQNYPTWSPNSQYVAVLRQSNIDFPYRQSILVINTETGEETIVTKVEVSNAKDEAELNIYPLDWSPDGQYLYFQKGAYNAVELWRFDVASGATANVNNISSAGIPRCYYLSPNGTHLLCLISSEDLTSYSITLVSTTSGDKSTILETVRAENFSDPLWSPDGSRLAMGVYNSTLKQAQANIIALQDGKTTRLLVNNIDASKSSVFPVGWSPDGNWLLVNVVDTEQGFYLVNADGKEVSELVLPAGATIIGWTADELAK